MKKVQLYAMVFLMALIAGCYPGGAEFVEEADAVYTNYDPSFNFNQTYTYSLPPGVIDIEDSENVDNPEYINAAYSNAIINDIRENLNALGWEEVDEEENPEVIVLASGFSSNFVYYYNPGWWGGYYPGYGPGWGWFYPEYSPGYVSGFTTGTVLIQMTEPGGINGNQVPVIWTAAINGLLQGSDANIIARIDSNIDQAFTQDPF
jgi:hypothetical protein